MSFEKNQWTTLSADQAAFFNDHTSAMGQAAFSRTAHEAGIVAQHAMRFTFGEGATGYQAILWPDSTQADTACVTVGNLQPGIKKQAFMRITECPASYAVEGVALGLTYGPSANMYGHQILQRYDTPQKEHTLPRIALGFLAAAQEKASKSGPIVASHKPLKLNITGIDGDTTARLYRSMNTLADNLIVAGSPNVKNDYTEQTYDIARTLWRAATRSVADHPDHKDMLFADPNGQTRGVIFESPEGLTIIRRLATYPDSIAVTIAARPGVADQQLFVEQHTINARSAVLDVAAYPVEAYDPQVLVGILHTLNLNPRGEADETLATLGEAELVVLERKLIRILQERTEVDL
jgi:hypothetical protein